MNSEAVLPQETAEPTPLAGRRRLDVKAVAAQGLDLVIAAYALAIVVVLTTGGIDLGFLSIRDTAKPILVLALLLPVRVALGERSWLLETVRRPLRERLAQTTALANLRLPAAVVDVAFALLVTRLATFSIGFIANLLFMPSRERAFVMPFRRARFAEIFAAWDSGWYFDIASRGYYYTTDGQSSIAFFPLYPMLMRAVAWPFGGTPQATWVAGIVVACTSFALALIAIHRFSERIFGSRDVARRTVLYLAVFPFSLFFTRVYAESTFLLTGVLAIVAAHDRRWVMAGLWGGLATLARPNGMLIAIPLILMAMAGRPGWRGLVQRLTALTPVPLALAGYCAYVYTLSGDPLAWLNAQVHWGYTLWNPPWEQLLKMVSRLVNHGFYDYFFVSPMAPYRLFHGAAALIFLGLTPVVFKQLGTAMGTYVLVSLLVPLSGNALEGVGRYAAVLFPAFMVAGSVRSPRVHEAIIIAASLFLALFVCLFVTLRPIY